MLDRIGYLDAEDRLQSAPTHTADRVGRGARLPILPRHARESRDRAARRARAASLALARILAVRLPAYSQS